MTFLPTDYKVPENSGYMKLKDGENTFRVLSSAIVGYEYWTTENKPVRSKTPFTSTPNKREESKIKHFWAFVVYNRIAGAIQILQIPQISIQTDIMALVENAQWGDPKEYDITINRKGEGFDTSYSVMPNPKCEVSADILKEYASKTIKLEALYDGGDPFELETKEEVVPNPFDEIKPEELPV